MASLPGTKLKYIFPGISLFILFWEVNKVRKSFRLQVFAGYSTIKDSTARRILLTEKMKKPNGKTRYQLVTFLHELLFLFIIYFLSFPLHVKRIIFCFVYSDDHKPSITYPSLEEESPHSSCFIDVDPIPSLKYMFSMIYIYPYLLKLIILLIL